MRAQTTSGVIAELHNFLFKVVCGDSKRSNLSVLKPNFALVCCLNRCLGVKRHVRLSQTNSWNFSAVCRTCVIDDFTQATETLKTPLLSVGGEKT